jgi:hypothetical protein
MNWIICVSNDGFEASLEARKLYTVTDDEKAAKRGLLRVVDESGEGYLYPKDMFMPMVIAQPIEQRLLQAA